MNKKAILTVGVSASGKSTWVIDFIMKEQIHNPKTKWVDVNRDDIRFNYILNGCRDWTKYIFSKSNESKVTEIQYQLLKNAIDANHNIIVSDTNLSKKTRNSLRSYLENFGYQVEEKPFPITLEEAIQRDNLRVNGVGFSVIYKQFQKWNEYIDRKTYKPNLSKPRAVICDVDGTIAHMTGRFPYEFSAVSSDRVDYVVKQFIYGMIQDSVKIIFLSGRDDSCYDDTHTWLVDNLRILDFQLFMRKTGDYRKDSFIKEEIFWNEIADNYNVLCAIDDRQQVLMLWLELGIKTISVGNPYIPF
jgi:predicted kinase